MRAFVLFLFAIVLMVSCRNETVPEAENADTADVVGGSSTKVDSAPYSVEYNEKTQGLSLVRSKENIEKAGVEDLIRALNKKHEGIKLDLVKSGKDTIEVKIDDANKLTQGMGTTGAEAYLAEVTFSLTELKGIKAVKIDFEEGDHAMPGVYSRNDFKDLIGSDEK